ncbi:hypothetical protein BLNAU_1002 [Blattamonas nauphoetae]|uniref:TmcB/TmcC TPR repeats domain-containing protein n=1 Tax=Blattamonas nauphoetae TaxID=2049346 RepID=A0ABQ9YJI7_9EUKA|nr:hypothetical protein BLNAU_1002 [Blattamonas nauphoetae]
MEPSTQNDEQRSIARSQSSELSTIQALSVARFRAFDQLLFYCMYPLSRNISLPLLIEIGFLVFIAVQFIGISTRFHTWPVSGKFGTYFMNVFHYLDFTISWSLPNVYLVFIITIAAFVLLIITSVAIASAMTRLEKPIPKKFSSFTALLTRLACTMFALPFVNVFSGGLGCLIPASPTAPQPPLFTTPIILTCGDLSPAFAAVGISFVVVTILLVFLYQLFVFDSNFKRHWPFATQSNIIPALLFLCTAILCVLSPVLAAQALIHSVITLVTFLMFTLLFMFYQPFFTIIGNALYAVACFLGFMSALITLLSVVIFKTTPADLVLPIIFMIACLLVTIGGCIGVFILTMKVGKSSLAMVKGEPVPIMSEKMKSKFGSVSRTLKQSKSMSSFVPTSSPRSVFQPYQPQPSAVIAPITTSAAVPSTPPNTLPRAQSPKMEENDEEMSEMGLNLPDGNDDKHIKLIPPEQYDPDLPKTSALSHVSVHSPTVVHGEITPNLSVATPRVQDHLNTNSQGVTEFVSPRIAQPTLRASASTGAIPSDARPAQEQPLLSEQLNPPRTLPKYRNVLSVQHALRFMQQPGFSREDDSIQLMESILGFALYRFPSSSSLWITACLYYRDFSLSTMKAAETLQHAKQCAPHIGQRWMEFSFLRDLELSKSTNGEQSASAMFRTQMERAKKYHDIANAYINQVWIQLSKTSFDVERVMINLTKGIDSFTDARKQYKKLLQTYPTSGQVLRGYGSLVRDIERDDDLALTFFNQASRFEDSAAQHSTSDEASLVSKTSAGYQTNQGMNSSSKPRGQKKGNGKKRSNGLSDSSLLIEGQKDVTKDLKVLFLMLPIVTVIITVISFVLTFSTFNDTIALTEIIHLSSLVQVQTSIVVMELEYWKIMNSRYLRDDPTIPDRCDYLLGIEDVKNTLHLQASDLADTLLNAYSQSPSDFYRTQFEKPITTLYYASVDISLRMNKIWPKTTMFLSHNEVNFVHLNVPVIMYEFLKRLACGFSAEIGTSVNIAMISNYILCAVLIVVSIFPLSFHYIWKIKIFTKHRRDVFFRFVSAPKHRYLKLKERLDHASGGDDEDTVNLSTVTVEQESESESEKADVRLEMGFGSIQEPREAVTPQPTPPFSPKVVPPKVTVGLLRSPSELFNEFTENRQNKVPTQSQEEPLLHRSSIRSLRQPNNFPNSNSAAQLINPQKSISPMQRASMSGSLGLHPNQTISLVNLNSEPQPGAQNYGQPIDPRNLRRSSSGINMSGVNTVYGMNTMNGMPGANGMNANGGPGGDFPVCMSQPETEKNSTDNTTAIPYDVPNQNDDSKKDGEQINTDDHEREDESLENEDLFVKVQKMGSIKPTRLRVFLFIAIGINWIAVGLSFAISIIALDTVGKARNELYLSFTQVALLHTINFLAIQIPFKPNHNPPMNFEEPESTRPGWSDFSHIGLDSEKHQDNILLLLTYTLVIHRKVQEGAEPYDPRYITSDERMDEVATPRTLVEGSEMFDIAMQSTKCILTEPELCDTRILYGINGEFGGLEGLITLYASAATNIASVENPDAVVIPENPDLQMICTMMHYDLNDALLLYSEAIQANLNTQVSLWNAIIISVSIACLIINVLFTETFLFLASRIISKMERTTLEMEILDPHNDTTLHAVEWREEYNCDLERYDKAHAAICASGVRVLKDRDSEEWDKNKRKVLARFTTLFFCVLADEEVMMDKHRIGNHHIRRHHRQHVKVIQQMTQALTHLYKSTPQSSQIFIQSVSSWLKSHVSHLDLDMSARLEEKITQFEIEEEIASKDLTIPSSFLHFLSSDNCSMANRKSFDVFMSTLHLSWEHLQ